MAAKLVSLVLICIGLLHLYPALGMLSGERLRGLYGVEISDPNLVILMRHRAVLFGLLGVFLISVAFNAGWQPAAFAAGFISMASFVVLALLQGAYNPLLRKVLLADIVGLLALLVAVALYLVAGSGRASID